MEPSWGSRHRRFETAAGFLLPSAVFLLILLRFGIIPFGGKTLLFSDLDTQYVEFMAEYRRILLGQGSFFYSRNAGMGMNFLAIIAYYLASPFNFLLVFFPDDGLSLAVSLITVLKIGCAGGTCGLFLRKRFGRVNDMIPLFAVCYALSGWVMAYGFNLMWLDAVILLPLLCIGIENLLAGGRLSMAKLTLFFALSFLSQFYMAYMMGIFCTVYFMTRLFVLRFSLRNTLRTALHFALCVGIAAGLSAIELVPTFFVLKNNMGLLGQTFPSFSGSFPLYRIFSKMWLGSYDGIKDCLPHIFCGILPLIGLVLFFRNREIPGRNKAAAALTGLLLVLSFWLRPLDFFWHAMDHPSWFPYRYAFLFPFWLVSSACEGFQHENRPETFGIAAAVCLVPLLIFITTDKPEVTILLLNLVFLILYPLLFRINDRSRTLIVTLLCCAELMLSGCLTLETVIDSYTSVEDYRSFHESYHTLAEQVLPGEDDFYRMEKTAYRNYNDPLGIGYPGVSHFSSTASTRQTEFLKRLGFNCYASWCTYQGATSASDALLRIRYEFGETGKSDSIAAAMGIWEHPAQFPLFFFADESFARYDLLSDDVNAIERQDDLLCLLEGGDAEPYFMPVPVELTGVGNLEEESWDFFRRIEQDRPAWVDVRITKVPGKSNYLIVPGASLNYTVTVNGTRQVISANKDFAPFPVCLDNLSDRESLEVRVATGTGTLEGGIYAYALDTNRLFSLAEAISADAPEIESASDTEYLLRTGAADRDRLVISSIPFDSGWHVSADGKELALKMIHESVLGFVLPAGSETIRVWFRPYGWEYGVVISEAALLCFAGLIFMEKRKQSKQ